MSLNFLPTQAESPGTLFSEFSVCEPRAPSPTTPQSKCYSSYVFLLPGYLSVSNVHVMTTMEREEEGQEEEEEENEHRTSSMTCYA